MKILLGFSPRLVNPKYCYTLSALRHVKPRRGITKPKQEQRKAFKLPDPVEKMINSLPIIDIKYRSNSIILI